MYHLNYEDGDKYFWNSTLKPIVVYRIDAIYYGALGAYLVKVFPDFWKKTKWISLSLSFLLLLAINIYVSIYNHHIHSDPFFWNIFALPLYSIVILLALPFFSLWKKAPTIIKKPVTFISIISYGIYLLHYSVTLYFIDSFSKITSINLPLFVQITLYMSISISLAYLLYIFYEKPMMDIRDHPKLRAYFKK
jgi:peptidoglycan/LPS O-acetylase OafA/YrhL